MFLGIKNRKIKIVYYILKMFWKLIRSFDYYNIKSFEKMVQKLNCYFICCDDLMVDCFMFVISLVLQLKGDN